MQLTLVALYGPQHSRCPAHGHGSVMHLPFWQWSGAQQVPPQQYSSSGQHMSVVKTSEQVTRCCPLGQHWPLGAQ